MPGVLDGIRVIDLCRMGPGRGATALLADYGADVICIADPSEVRRRGTGGPSGGVTNRRNKRSIMLNLKEREALEVLYKLVESADGFLESNRPGVAKRLGFDYETLRALNPKLVYCSLTGYGQYGPYAGLPGHDISYQGTGGMLVKGADGHPQIPPYNQGDINAATNGAMAMLMGLLYAQRTGKGEYIDVAFSDGAIPHAIGGIPRGVLRGTLPCYNIYETKDGRHLTLSVLEPWFWERLCGLLGKPEWIPQHFAQSPELVAEMFAYFRESFKTKTLAEWFEALKEADVEFGPVNETVEQVKNDPHHIARESMIEVTEPVTGRKTMQPGFIYKFANNPATLRRDLSILGSETLEVLRELGYGEEKIEELEKSGAVAHPDKVRKNWGR